MIQWNLPPADNLDGNILAVPVKYDIGNREHISLEAENYADIQLLKSCRPLGEYSLFIESVRKYMKEEPDRSRAVSRAIRDLPEDSELRRFLEAHEAEVREMCLTEYDEKEEREQLSQEFREIGREEGLAEGEQRLGALITKLRELGLVNDAFKAAADPEFRNRLYKQYNL